MNTFSPQHIGAGSSPRNSTTPSPRGHRIPPGPVITTSIFSPQHIGAGSSTRRNSTSPSPVGHRIPPGPRLSYIPLPVMTPTTTPATLGNSARSLEPLSPPPYEQVMAADQHDLQRTPRSRRASMDQHASGSGPGLGFEAGAQPTQPPSTLSPLRSFVPSPQAPRRSPVHDSRSPSPMSANTQRPFASPSRAAPSPGYNAAPIQRPAAPRSPPPEALNARQRRRLESLAQQQLSAPSVHRRASPGRGVAQAYPPASLQAEPSSSPAVRRHSVQPTARAQRASRASAQALASGSAIHRQNPPMDFTGPSGPPAHAHAIPQYTAPALASAPAERVAPAAAYSYASASLVPRFPPTQQPAPSPIAVKRAHDAEHVQKCARRVRRKQEKAEEAARQADAARRSVERATPELDQAYAIQDGGRGQIAQDAGVAPDIGDIATTWYGAAGRDSSGYPLIDAIHGQPGEFAAVFEAVAQRLGIGRNVYLRDPSRVLRLVLVHIRTRQSDEEYLHPTQVGRPVQMGEAGPSSSNARRSPKPARVHFDDGLHRATRLSTTA
ncbi:hypothetical protein PENSPDRAFT_107565 [Peniophora sp. CONT]|nr:hypothetical protein PENSPDRAFT_107565 [Peniophora sp. CONT]